MNELSRRLVRIAKEIESSYLLYATNTAAGSNSTKGMTKIDMDVIRDMDSGYEWPILRFDIVESIKDRETGKTIRKVIKEKEFRDFSLNKLWDWAKKDYGVDEWDSFENMVDGALESVGHGVLRTSRYPDGDPDNFIEDRFRVLCAFDYPDDEHQLSPSEWMDMFY